jgi:hypothetical protein
MGADALQAIRDAVHAQKVIPVEMDMGYKVVFSTLQGNIPVNNRISGSILDIPVDIRLDYSIIPNTGGSLPVNTVFDGFIGDTHIQERMMHKIVFSTIAGNIPVNTGIEFKSNNGARYRLEMPISFASGSARGGSMASSDGGGKKKSLEPKYIAGKMIQPDDLPDDGGGGIASEAGRPLPGRIYGVIEDIEIDFRFSFTYYCNTSSGRNPINNRLTGEIRVV